VELIDACLPAWEFRERHTRRIAAAPARALEALPGIDLADSPVIGPLFALRSLGSREPLRAGLLGEFLDRAFVRLHEVPGRGVVFGAIGRFWSGGGGIVRFAPGDFATDRSPGCARLAWAFEFAAEGPSGCLAVTETRIACNDAAARWRMRAYWLAIRPASGLIRREMLRLLAARCSDPRPGP
jgi:hypothetical protein